MTFFGVFNSLFTPEKEASPTPFPTDFLADFVDFLPDPDLLALEDFLADLGVDLGVDVLGTGDSTTGVVAAADDILDLGVLGEDFGDLDLFGVPLGVSSFCADIAGVPDFGDNDLDLGAGFGDFGSGDNDLDLGDFFDADLGDFDCLLEGDLLCLLAGDLDCLLAGDLLGDLLCLLPGDLLGDLLCRLAGDLLLGADFGDFDLDLLDCLGVPALRGLFAGDSSFIGDVVNFAATDLLLRTGVGEIEGLSVILGGIAPLLTGVEGGSFLSKCSGESLGPKETLFLFADGARFSDDFLFFPLPFGLGPFPEAKIKLNYKCLFEVRSVKHNNVLLSYQPRVTVTSCFVYKVVRDL